MRFCICAWPQCVHSTKIFKISNYTNRFIELYIHASAFALWSRLHARTSSRKNRVLDFKTADFFSDKDKNRITCTLCANIIRQGRLSSAFRTRPKNKVVGTFFCFETYSEKFFYAKMNVYGLFVTKVARFSRGGILTEPWAIRENVLKTGKKDKRRYCLCPASGRR